MPLFIIPVADSVFSIFLQAREQCTMGTVVGQVERAAPGSFPSFCYTSCSSFDPVNYGDQEKKRKKNIKNYKKN